MPYSSIMDDIVFIEGDETYIESLGIVEYKPKFLAWNQQLKNLNDVKKELAIKAKQKNANAIINFEYGQASTSFWHASLFASDDNIKWYGKGTAVRLSDSTYYEYINKNK